MDVSLVYAIPVHAADLGAHLEAYVDALPTLTTLRLCNRYGKGDRVFISKLPIELVKLVEHHLVQPIRERHCVCWRRDLKCFELKCDMLDHLSFDDKLDIYFEMIDYYGPPTDDDAWEDPSEETVDRVLSRHSFPGYDDCWEGHYDRRGGWLDRVGRDRSGLNIFEKHKSLISAHFGVDIWRSNVRLPQSDADFWDAYEAPDTTVTYLTMPNHQPRSERWYISEGEMESGIFGCESGYGVPVVPGQPPSAKSLRRFARAMKILDLEVFVHKSQQGHILTQPVKDGETTIDNKVAYDAESWPQLTLLTRSTVVE